MKNPIHPSTIVETTTLGRRARVGAFCHLQRGAKIGEDCQIGSHVVVESGAVVGDRVTLRAGVQVWRGVSLEDDVLVGQNATFMVERRRGPGRRTSERPTLVRHGAAIGANATILAGVTIGMNALIGAGAVVTHDVPPNAIVIGNPARITGYQTGRMAEMPRPADARRGGTVRVPGVRVVKLPLIADLRGNLTVAEFQGLPFKPKRFFTVSGVPSKDTRGQHAHKRQHQFLICMRGSCSIVVDDGRRRDEISLNAPDIGLHVPPMVWALQYRHSADSLLFVLSSGSYDPGDYIRDYDDFKRAVRR